MAKTAKPANKAIKKPQQKKVIKKTKTATRKEATGIKVEEIVHKVNPKLTLTSDAVELLNALLTEKFTQIAHAASAIVAKGQQESLGCKEVKEAVRQVFNSKFSS